MPRNPKRRSLFRMTYRFPAVGRPAESNPTRAGPHSFHRLENSMPTAPPRNQSQRIDFPILRDGRRDSGKRR